ncbi:calcium-binding protein, partial [Ruegeria sp. NA]|nr:calcium-binding protein [Ruegeria sp. NA]
DDVLNGGEGEDTVFGGDGDDFVFGIEEGAAERDFLNGGAGDDTILAGGKDVVTGGDGADDIVLNPGDDQVTVMGFQPGEDKLLVTWEDETDPAIEVEADAENANLTRVFIDGQEVAQVYGAEGMTAADIQLITEAQLAQYGQMV